MGLCTSSFFGTTAKSCGKYNCIWQETRQDQQKNMLVWSYLTMATKNGVPQKGPLIFSDHFHHWIPQDSQWPWPETKTIRCWQMWLNAQPPYKERIWISRKHSNFDLPLRCLEKNHETPKAWNFFLWFFPMPLFLPVFTQNFRYLKWRYILNLVRLFWGFFGGCLVVPYISRIHTA